MEAASRLRHERCVRAYDFGGDSGHVYIAYEYIHGRTLRELLRSGKLRDREAVEAGAQILDALAHAHRLGIVHRDVKPSNVLVEESSKLSIRLLDFGLAQFDEADTLTAVGDVPGTLAYIAPERLTGGDATAASDVWAVGVLLWEALAGQHPFWGVPLPQVAAAIQAGAKPIGDVRPDLPAPIAAAVASALTVDPAQRPSAERLAAALRAALAAPAGARSRPRRRQAEAAPAAAPAVPLERRLASAALAALSVAVAAALLPFWPPGLVLLLALGAALAMLRTPRLGLAIALFVPLFPLGNVAQAAAVTYGVLALAWLAVCWRDARAGLLFAAGPLLASIGAIALLPLAVQPARGRAPARPAGRRRRARRGGSRRPPRRAPATHRLGRSEPRARRLDAGHGRRPGSRGRSARQPGARRPRPRARRCRRSSPGCQATRAEGDLRTRSLPDRARRGARTGTAAPARRPRDLRALRRPHGRLREGRPLPLAGSRTPGNERPAKHRELDRAPLRRRFRSCLQDARAARRARAQAGQGDGRAPLGVRLPGLRTERVHDLPLELRPAAVRLVRGFPHRRAAGVPDRARAARGVCPADAAACQVRGRRRPGSGRVRHRHARRAAGRGDPGPAGGSRPRPGQGLDPELRRSRRPRRPQPYRRRRRSLRRPRRLPLRLPTLPTPARP